MKALFVKLCFKKKKNTQKNNTDKRNVEYNKVKQKKVSFTDNVKIIQKLLNVNIFQYMNP